MIVDIILKSRAFELVKALSKKERALLIGAVVVFITSSGIYGTLFIQNKSILIPTEGGELREGIIGQPVFINPVIPTTDVDRDISRIVFSSVAEVADSIKRSSDGKIWNVRLKENVLWHDGHRLTADDIIFTLETIQDPDSRSPLHTSFSGVAAERISELEVQFVLQNSYVFFESDHLKNLRIIPKHIFSEIPIQNIKLSRYGLNPIGSGPYKIDSFEKNSAGVITKFKLKSNKDYFDGKPNLKTIEFKFYRNSKELINAYNLGQITSFGLSTTEPLTQNKIRIRSENHYFKTPRYYALFINKSLSPEAVSDIDVRNALTKTVDRTRIIDEVFLSHAIPFFGPTELSTDFIEEYDTTLLQDLELTLTIPEEPFLIKTAEILKENWESYGAKVTINIISLREIQEETLRNSNYKMILFGNITKENQDLFAFWHSSRRFYPDQNLALYQNKGVDALLETYRKTFNTEERSKIIGAISDAIAEDVPAIFLYSPQYTYISAPRIKGINDEVILNTSDDRFDDIENWFVNTTRVFSNPDKEDVESDT